MEQPTVQATSQAVLIFDTETDGLAINSLMQSNVKARIIEFFGLVLEQHGSGPEVAFKEVHTFHSLYNPDRIITEDLANHGQLLVPERITSITGLTMGDLAGAPVLGTVEGVALKNLIQNADLVVAHNLAFDMAIIDQELTRVGLSYPVWPPGLCTVKATEWLTGKRMSLTDLHNHLFGKGFKAHRAETDVRALADCYMELVRREFI